MRFSYNDVDNYGNSGNSNFFQLKEDGDSARVRFMYNTIEDIEGLAVHQIELGDKKRYVNCVRAYNDPIDKCPLCKANYKVIAKMFVLLYNVDTDEVLIWERGKKFFQQISSLCSRYPDRLCSQVFEIVRHGKKGDTQTSYEIWPVGQPDETTLDALPEPPEILGSGIVLDKSAEELDYYVRYGEFPDSNNNASREAEFRRPATSQQAMRRTPTRNGNDTF